MWQPPFGFVLLPQVTGEAKLGLGFNAPKAHKAACKAPCTFDASNGRVKGAKGLLSEKVTKPASV